MISADTSAFIKLRDDLHSFAKRGVPFAARNALNASAFTARKEWAGQLAKSMTLRNTFTVRSLRVVKAGGYDLGGMQSQIGSIAGYLATQEHGGIETKRGKVGKPIPTNVAAGGSMKARPRKRLVQQKHWLSALKVAAHGSVTGRRQRRNAVALVQAAKGSGVAFLDLGRRKGLFKVDGTKSGRLRIRMLWDLSRASVVIPKRPTLQQTLDAIKHRLPGIWVDAMVQQLQRYKILGHFIGPRQQL